MRLRQALRLFRDPVEADEAATKAYVDAKTGGAHTIQDEGTSLTARARLNFRGAGVRVTDDSVAGTTHVDIPGGDVDGGAAATTFAAGQAVDGGAA